jgi:hypothetical protein
MAVRKIPKNYLVVTGSFAGRKNAQMDAFESLLEKEYMLLLDFDDRVERFDAQPVIVPVSGVPRGYTPDVLVHYLPDSESGEIRKPLLTEVKHTDDLRRNSEKYAPKFAAAEKYASERDWEFRVTTQIDIRTQRLANLKFLREYRNIQPAQQANSSLIQAVRKAGGISSPKILLERLAATDDDRLYWLPIIWHAVVTRQLITDWDRPVDYDAALHLPAEIR